jgi:CBS domain-containing protein
VADAMHRGVITCRSGVPGRTAARIMAAHRIHSTVVVDEDGTCLGVVTDGDVAEALARGTIGTQSVDEIARTPAAVGPLEPIGRAAELMHERHTTHVVVVEPTSGRPVGVLSALDLLEIIAEGDEPELPTLIREFCTDLRPS